MYFIPQVDIRYNAYSEKKCKLYYFSYNLSGYPPPVLYTLGSHLSLTCWGKICAAFIVWSIPAALQGTGSHSRLAHPISSRRRKRKYSLRIILSRGGGFWNWWNIVLLLPFPEEEKKSIFFLLIFILLLFYFFLPFINRKRKEFCLHRETFFKIEIVWYSSSFCFHLKRKKIIFFSCGYYQPPNTHRRGLNEAISARY